MNIKLVLIAMFIFGLYFTIFGLKLLFKAAFGLGVDIYSLNIQGIANSLIENISSAAKTTQNQTSKSQNNTSPTIINSKDKK